MKNKKALWKRILKILGILVGVFLAVVIVTVTILTITEYRPEDIEEVSVEEGAKTTLQNGISATADWVKTQISLWMAAPM